MGFELNRTAICLLSASCDKSLGDFQRMWDLEPNHGVWVYLELRYVFYQPHAMSLGDFQSFVIYSPMGFEFI